jgi:hypothetical protein
MGDKSYATRTEWANAPVGGQVTEKMSLGLARERSGEHGRISLMVVVGF